MHSEDKENQNGMKTTPKKKATKKRNIQQRKVLSPNQQKSPNSKKQRRVSFATMKKVFDENVISQQIPQVPRRTSIATFSTKNKRKSIAKGTLTPKKTMINTNEKPKVLVQSTKTTTPKDEDENLENFKQELVCFYFSFILMFLGRSFKWFKFR